MLPFLHVAQNVKREVDGVIVTEEANLVNPLPAAIGLEKDVAREEEMIAHVKALMQPGAS